MCSCPNSSPASRQSLSARFWSKVKVDGNCWVWTGATDGHGYGNMTLHQGHTEKAHRVAWFMIHGEIPGRKNILHDCDNPPCILHLFKGTHLDNMRDMFLKGRRQAAVGQKNARSKLTVSQVRKIRDLYARGAGTYRSLGRMFRVDNTTIWAVLHRRQWKWVN